MERKRLVETLIGTFIITFLLISILMEKSSKLNFQEFPNFFKKKFQKKFILKKSICLEPRDNKFSNSLS
ncbi:hypothetical protein COT60_01970 [Candidatus Pacearchaeota archaeon CG09_land_8_20_14_0_10_30_9]|nr:MAG: hypothetical protein AUJ61_02440 [Candidatus Pacearchaeota archaeon CG1_02_30_18]PIN71416.1 MAG: hypothetical protein COV77_02160 [Candidatus Pacearchaeota archaeon CG11_big_fil_rev_8_21_14_0_20_30_13]PIO01154.1 MAG: hypothetical protein COT60_01970 [Candidatus Pacearchaeota archaeon CG09_land_8_20_14_0_10_30_9]